MSGVRAHNRVPTDACPSTCDVLFQDTDVGDFTWITLCTLIIFIMQSGKSLDSVLICLDGQPSLLSFIFQWKYNESFLLWLIPSRERFFWRLWSLLLSHQLSFCRFRSHWVGVHQSEMWNKHILQELGGFTIWRSDILFYWLWTVIRYGYQR